MSPPERPELLDCPFDLLTLQAAADECLRWCHAARLPRTVITANAAILCMMRRDPELREACRRGDLILADGMSVVWAGRLAGLPFPERATGCDLMARLLQAASDQRLSVYFLGARPQVVQDLVARCARELPGLVVAGARDGYFTPQEHAEVVADIRQRAPHMLFVGMPSPFKETWCERHREALGVPVIMGVGGSFDVLAGHVRRAPRLLQSLGLEWSWRLAMEPRKLWRAAGEILGRRAGRARHQP